MIDKITHMETEFSIFTIVVIIMIAHENALIHPEPVDTVPKKIPLNPLVLVQPNTTLTIGHKHT